MTESTKQTINIDEMVKKGTHFGFAKSRRHPTANKYIHSSKNRNDIFDIQKTIEALDKSLEFISSIKTAGGTVLLIGGKNEAQDIIKETAKEVGMPFVAGRWIGGTLTNFSEIRKRVDTMLSLCSQREKGELAKYTKKERLLIDRDIAKLEKMFGGISNMTTLPKAVFIVDPRFDNTALKEAKMLNIPVIALCGSDNNFKEIDYPIPANDSARASIKYFAEMIKNVLK